MDDDSIGAASRIKGEATNKVKDRYYQLAEKVEQVRSQMANMERKYDELYKTVKEKDNRSSSVAMDQESPESIKSQRESVTEPVLEPKESKPKIKEEPVQSPPEPKEEKPVSKPASTMDIEKLEDNPFM